MTNSGSNSQLDLTHWIIRLIAYIIDSIIIAIPTYIIWYVVLLSIIFSGGVTGFVAAYGFAFIFPFFFGIIQLLYFVILDVSWGATIGKRVMGLSVQTTSGGKVDFGKAFIRNISKIFWLFLILDWLIGIATTGSDKRQKFTDRWAGTTVVQTGKSPIAITSPPPSSPPPPPPAPPAT
jgi:uncharacterized RDD family membrane protein YckC